MAFTYKQRVEPFSPERMEALARVLADTERGLTGSEIGQILAQSKIDDPAPGMTKWKRLYNAFAEFQNREQVGNHVVVFLTRAMDPAKYTSDIHKFHWRRDQLNPILAFCGMTLGEDGKVRRISAAETLTQALERANRVQAQSAPPKPDAVSKPTLKISELILAFVTRELSRYSTAERHCFRAAIRVLRQLCGATPVAEFGPLRFQMLRDAMVAGAKGSTLPPEPDGSPAKDRKPWCRKTANRQAKRIRHAFRSGGIQRDGSRRCAQSSGQSPIVGHRRDDGG